MSSPLMSLGRLLRKGWSIEQRLGGLCLCNGPEAVEIPISFKRNSLVVQAGVHMVEASEPEAEVKPVVADRVRVKLNFPVEHVSGQWDFLNSGDPVTQQSSLPVCRLLIPLPKWAFSCADFGQQSSKSGNSGSFANFRNPWSSVSHWRTCCQV